MGGLARRAWVIEELKRDYPDTPVLALDAGNFSDVPTARGEHQTEVLIEAMNLLGYRVVNVGERDVRTGYEDFRRRAANGKFGFVSANVVRREGESPIFDANAVVEVPRADGDPIRVGVTGAVRFNPVFDKQGPDGSEMVMIHPVEPVRKQVEALRSKKVDVVVLLAAMPVEDAALLVEEVPGIDFVFGAFAGETKVERVGDTEIMYMDNRGQCVGETRVFFKDDGSIGSNATLHRLGREYPSDGKMADFVKSHQAAEPSKAEAKAVARRAGDSKLNGPFTGTGECRRCHASEHAQWEASAHARAMDALEEEERSDASCLACHVTGWETAGGFVSYEATPGLASVGCESCHGPGRTHLRNLAARYGAVEVSTCTGCHDRDNDPDFDYYALVPRVAHGSSQASSVTGP